MDFNFDNRFTSSFSQPNKISSSRLRSNTFLVLLAKGLLVIGVYLLYNLLKSVDIIQLAFLIKLISSIANVLFWLVRRQGSHQRFSRREVYHSAGDALMSVLLLVFWMEGLKLYGPVRTILVYYQSDILIQNVLGKLLYRDQTVPNANRGVFYYACGLICLLFFDKELQKSGDGEFTMAGFTASSLVSLIGLSDHMTGTALVFTTALLQNLQTSYRMESHMYQEYSNKFRALVTIWELVILAPLYLFTAIVKGYDTPLTSYTMETFFVALFVFVLNSHVDEHVNLNTTHRFSLHRMITAVTSLAALVCYFVLDHWEFMVFKHKFSSGLIFAFVFFFMASRIAIQPSQISSTKGTLIGYSTSGLPLYHHTPRSRETFLKIRQYIRTVVSSPESRSIFFYLCLNLLFTFVELLYGVWTNSLGLISDGFHMLFDCSALVLGLWAAMASKWSATKTFSYGFGRIEVLSGFVNGLFLVVIAFAVFLTAVQRIYDPPHVHSENLLTVSVLGLIVNLIGITAFNHAHSHGGKTCDGHGHSNKDHDSHSHGHAHSHGDDSHSHSHSHSHGSKKKGSQGGGNANMQGVFLHVLADTLGSVGVIISSLLIKHYGLNIADPICSLLIAFMIIASVIPLLYSSSMVLLQRTPQSAESYLTDALEEIKRQPHVLSCRQLNVWEYTQGVSYGSLIIQVNLDASEHTVRQQVITVLKTYGISHITVQVEKPSFYDHMVKLTTGTYSVRLTQNLNTHVEGLLKSSYGSFVKNV